MYFKALSVNHVLVGWLGTNATLAQKERDTFLGNATGGKDTVWKTLGEGKCAVLEKNSSLIFKSTQGFFIALVRNFSASYFFFQPPCTRKIGAWHNFWSLTRTCGKGGRCRSCWLDVCFTSQDKLLGEQASLEFQGYGMNLKDCHIFLYVPGHGEINQYCRPFEYTEV